jgi:hypothetical protein
MEEPRITLVASAGSQPVSLYEFVARRQSGWAKVNGNYSRYAGNGSISIRHRDAVEVGHPGQARRYGNALVFRSARITDDYPWMAL